MSVTQGDTWARRIRASDAGELDKLHSFHIVHNVSQNDQNKFIEIPHRNRGDDAMYMKQLSIYYLLIYMSIVNNIFLSLIRLKFGVPTVSYSCVNEK